LKTVSTYRDRTIILSGDIHYGGAVRLDHWEEHPSSPSPHSSVIIQLTSSAMKNAELATYLVHTRLKSLFPEPAEYWLGQQTRIAWIPRQKAKSTQLPSTQHWCQRAQQPHRLARSAISWLWRNRWFQEGPEVVGHNNFGIVTWTDPDADSLQDICHDIYWYPPWDMTCPVLSQYQAALAPGDAPLKASTFIPEQPAV
jgi:hypothetical protein